MDIDDGETPPRYRDGLGRPLPDAEQEFRTRALLLLEQALAPRRRLEFRNLGRAGEVIYVDAGRRIVLEHEIGGGDCRWWIAVPRAEEWVLRTGAPLSERAEILRFVAETAQREQASGWRFEIAEDAILFFAARDR